MSADKREHRMAFDPDDARLTAYVLGELEGQERAAIEALLAESAEARAFVEGLREAAAEVEAAIAGHVLAESRVTVVYSLNPAVPV